MTTQVETSNTKKKSKNANASAEVAPVEANTVAAAPDTTHANATPATATSTTDDDESSIVKLSERYESHTAQNTKCARKVSLIRVIGENPKAAQEIAWLSEHFEAERKLDANRAIAVEKIRNLDGFVTIEKAPKVAKILVGGFVRIKNALRIDAEGKPNKKFALIPEDELDMLEVVSINDTNVVVKAGGGTVSVKLLQIEPAGEALSAGTLVKVAPKFRTKYAFLFDAGDDLSALNDLSVKRSTGTQVLVNAGDGLQFPVKRSHLIVLA